MCTLFVCVCVCVCVHVCVYVVCARVCVYVCIILCVCWHVYMMFNSSLGNNGGSDDSGALFGT